MTGDERRTDADGRPAKSGPEKALEPGHRPCKDPEGPREALRDDFEESGSEKQDQARGSEASRFHTGYGRRPESKRRTLTSVTCKQLLTLPLHISALTDAAHKKNI